VRVQPGIDRERAKASPDHVDTPAWALTEFLSEGTAWASIDHYGAMAAAANASPPPPMAGDALPWRPKPARSRPVVDNELIDLNRETADATLSNRNLRCRNCGECDDAGRDADHGRDRRVVSRMHRHDERRGRTNDWSRLLDLSTCLYAARRFTPVRDLGGRQHRDDRESPSP
jgi:hypothetical protein